MTTSPLNLLFPTWVAARGPLLGLQAKSLLEEIPGVATVLDRYRPGVDSVLPVADKIAPQPVETLEVAIPSSKLPVQVNNLDTRLLSYKGGRTALKTSFEDRGIALLAIRHGQSEMNASAVPVTSGQIETPLTEKGHGQAREAAQKLYQQLGGQTWLEDLAAQRTKMPALYASPLSRAQDTAQAFVDYVAEQGREAGLSVNLPITVDNRLLEMHFGKYEGHPDSESWDEHPSLWSEKEFAQRCPRGESRVDVMERLWSFLGDVRDRHQDQTVLMFCHLMPVALTQVLMGDGRTDDAGTLQIHRPDFPNATPMKMTNPVRQSSELGYLLA